MQLLGDEAALALERTRLTEEIRASEVRAIVAWDLVNVEGMPFEALAQGITWDWVSCPEYMDAAQRRGLGINLAFLTPLTPVRYFVMGEESRGTAGAIYGSF